MLKVLLEEMTNEELIQEYRAGNREAYEVLFKKNENFPYYIVDKYAIYFGSIEKEELVSEASFGMMKAVKYYDESKGYKFTTFAYKCMAGQIHNRIKTHKNKLKNMPTVSFDKLYTASEGKESLDDKTLLNLVPTNNIPNENTLYARNIIELFNLCANQEEKFLFDMRIVKSISLEELSKYFACTREAVRRKEIKLLKRLRAIKDQLDNYNFNYLKEVYLNGVPKQSKGRTYREEILYLYLKYPWFKPKDYNAIINVKRSTLNMALIDFRAGNYKVEPVPTYADLAERYILFNGLNLETI